MIGYISWLSSWKSFILSSFEINSFIYIPPLDKTVEVFVNVEHPSASLTPLSVRNFSILITSPLEFYLTIEDFYIFLKEGEFEPFKEFSFMPVAEHSNFYFDGESGDSWYNTFSLSCYSPEYYYCIVIKSI